MSRPILQSIQAPIKCVPLALSRLKQLECEADSFPPSAEVKNVGLLTVSSAICLHNMILRYMDNFTFTILRNCHVLYIFLVTLPKTVVYNKSENYSY
jgi:hypothetical protein